MKKSDNSSMAWFSNVVVAECPVWWGVPANQGCYEASIEWVFEMFWLTG